MADYVDYSAYEAANAPEEERLLNDAYARAEAADHKARLALGKARNEGTGSYDSFGRLQGGTDDITQTGSFSDFVQFQREAENARVRAQQAPGEDPRRQALRKSMAKQSGTSDRLDAMDASLEGTAANSANALRGQTAGRERMRNEETERRRISDEKAASRDQSAREAKQQYDESIRSKMADWWKRTDQRAKGFSFNNPFLAGGTTMGLKNADQWQLANEGKQTGLYGVGDIGEAQWLQQRGRQAGLNNETDRFEGGATYEWGKRTKGGY